MEDSENKKRLDQTTGETPLDTVDHDRLARLVAAPSVEAAAPPWEQGEVVPQAETARAAPARQIDFHSNTAAFQAAPVAASVAPKKSSSLALIIFALVGLAALLAAGGGIYFLTRSKATVRPTDTNNANQRKNPDRTGPPMKPDLVAIPGGQFQMGRADGAAQEGPPHTATVGAFYIDRTEVTNAEYAQFTEETDHAAPRHFVNGLPASGQEQWPVTNVSLEDAKAFAAWRSKRDGVTYRLPTEEEWEFAARDGSQGDIYPWGNTWAADKANVNWSSLKPVGTSPGDKTRAGVMDMIGNAYEWTSSRASLYAGSSMQLRPENKDWFVVRGGAYMTDINRKQISATYRDWIPPSTQNAGLGFRLVRSGS